MPESNALLRKNNTRFSRLWDCLGQANWLRSGLQPEGGGGQAVIFLVFQGDFWECSFVRIPAQFSLQWFPPASPAAAVSAAAGCWLLVLRLCVRVSRRTGAAD